MGDLRPPRSAHRLVSELSDIWMEWGLLFVMSSCEDCCSYPNTCVCDAHMETDFGRAHSQPGALLRVL